MSRPANFEGKQLLPPVDVLVTRMHAVEAELATLEAALQGDLDPRERAGTQAHVAALSRRRQWYLARIRSVRPVQALDVSVSESIHAEADIR